MAELTDFGSALKQLQEPSVPDSVLYELSNLHGDELALLTDTWPALPLGSRQAIASRLVEIAEADFETDFSRVFIICLKDKDPQVRKAAIDGLWEVEDVVLIRPLIRMLERDPSEGVREAAAVSLSRFAQLAELGRLQPYLADMVWDALWNTYHSPDEELAIRRRAVESLAHFGRPQVGELIEAAYQDEEPLMRISAVFAMGRSADEVWGSRVVAELEHDDPEMRYEAARACGALELVEAVPILSRMVADPDLEVKLAAVWALGQIGGREAQRVLEICLESGDEALKDAAENALDELDYMQGTLDFPLYNYDVDDDEEDEDEDEEEWRDEDEWEDADEWEDEDDIA
jgi:HEAT repeat protein